MSATEPPRKPETPRAARLPRGIRNHNPGNIRRNPSVQWRGAAPAEAQTDQEFVVFSAPEWGLRAIVRVLLSYDRHGVRTPAAIANRWAPAEGRRPDGTTYTQDSAAYARHLAAAIGCGLHDLLDLRNATIMHALVAAIVRHENGQQPYARDLIDRALDLAGLALPMPPT